jgi:hypothetical protein
LPLAFASGIAIASAASAHSSPTYVYAPPPYPYGYPYSYPQSHSPSGQQPAAPANSTFEQASHWVPSSPGAGHWVPDPTPYVYEPVAQARMVAASARPATQLVTISRPAGQVPIYTVTR